MKTGQHLRYNEHGRLVQVWAPLSQLSDVAFEALRLIPNARYVYVNGYGAARHETESPHMDGVLMDETFARAIIAYMRENAEEK